ncbi:MAG: hypothetical protein KBD83_00175 [Gammaproteobacteria bacterium]|nr:hypothetical protein [Gammaproteobacteria bacterium]
MHDSVLKPLSGTALFSASDFCEVNQLADLLFNAEEHAISLYSEHETVTQAWILSAIKMSSLAKKLPNHPRIYCAAPKFESTTFPENSWVYLGNGQIIRAGSTQEKIINLRFRTLSFEQRVKVLHQVCIESLQTHVLTIPTQTIKKALEWQSRYCADEQVLAETLLLLHRGVNRFLLTHADDKQAALLEPQHVAEVLVDWQQVALPDLLRVTEDIVELKLFLSEHIIGQTAAIEQFIQAKNRSKFFILAGTPYSGKKTFVEHYAQFTHGAKCFCIPFDLSFFASDADWSEIFLPTPHYNNDHSRLTLLEIISNYPQAVILLKNANENPDLLARLKRNIKKSFFQIDGQCVSISGITWMLLLDTTAPEPKTLVVQESIFAVDTSSELSDILYRPSIKISTDINDGIEIDENYVIEEVKKQLPETTFESACFLSFSPLTEKDKKHIINKEIKRIMHSLRATHDVSVYYQEEVVQFLLNQVNQSNQGFEALHKNLHLQIEHVFLKSLEQGVIADGQVLMLQLNDTGRVLQIVRTAARTGLAQAKLKI